MSQPGYNMTHLAQTTSCTTVTTVIFSKGKKKKNRTRQLNSVPAHSIRVGQVKFNPLFFLPVRNLLEANKDAEGRRFEIFQVSLGG